MKKKHQSNVPAKWSEIVREFAAAELSERGLLRIHELAKALEADIFEALGERMVVRHDYLVHCLAIEGGGFIIGDGRVGLAEVYQAKVVPIKA